MTLRPILCSLSLAATACVTSVASPQLIAVDSFSGPPVADLNGSTGGTGWTSAWLDQSVDTVTGISALGLSYTGLDTTPGAAVSDVGSGVYPIASYYRAFGALPAGTTKLYVSFLLRADANYGIWGGLRFGNYPFAMYVGSPPGMYSFGLMVSEGLGDISNAPLNQGETNLVIVQISKNAGAGITYKLYLNPVIGQAEPSFALAQFAIAQVNAIPTSLTLDNGGGFTTDEIRVGTTWSSVLPADPGCLGDLNLDSQVNGSDLAILLGFWGTAGADLNGDGTTDAADLAVLLGAWGACA